MLSTPTVKVFTSLPECPVPKPDEEEEIDVPDAFLPRSQTPSHSPPWEVKAALQLLLSL